MAEFLGQNNIVGVYLEEFFCPNLGQKIEDLVLCSGFAPEPKKFVPKIPNQIFTPLYSLHSIWRTILGLLQGFPVLGADIPTEDVLGRVAILFMKSYRNPGQKLTKTASKPDKNRVKSYQAHESTLKSAPRSSYKSYLLHCHEQATHTHANRSLQAANIRTRANQIWRTN